MAVELFVGRRNTKAATDMLNALQTAIAATGEPIERTSKYRGHAETLVLYGVGAPENYPVRERHVASGRKAVLVDLGYFGRQKHAGYLRFSINRDHPQHLLDATEPKPGRWESFGLKLREDYRPNGHVVLVGLGPKSRSYLSMRDWEQRKFVELQKRFGRQRILYRPKRKPHASLPCRMNLHGSIESVLHGASLVVCRHSNVAIDAVVAGVPFEADDGAATWLNGKPYTAENRLDFLRRLCWWQWRMEEAHKAWAFIKERL